MKVKICGITRAADARAAVEAGADALGFVFAESPRRVDPGVAADIIAALPPFVTPVGVFVNARRAEVLEAAERTGIRCAQLHGNHDPGSLQELPIRTVAAFRVGPGFELCMLERHGASAILLDGYSEGSHGGTGTTFDWSVAVEAKRFGPIILAGGLTPENVASAVQRVRPYAVDVSSGVETSPGRKDPRKIEAFLRAVRSAEI